MKRLNQANLNARDGGVERDDSIRRFTYQRSAVRPGVVHFGVGNFHRTHQAMYIERLLHQGHLDWGIVGVSLRSRAARDRLAQQDYLYTRVTLGERTELTVVGALMDILVASERPLAVINQLTQPTIKLVTTTVTEKGYCLAGSSVDTQHEDFQADLDSLAAPKTVYGYIAAGIIARAQGEQGIDPASRLNVVCCDNIQAGGARLGEGVTALVKQHSPNSLPWLEQHVCFASSMVDRVSPATSADLVDRVATRLTLRDAWPAAAEPFSQWVIEKTVLSNSPTDANAARSLSSLSQCGVQFSHEIGLYEQMKLQLLNAAHSAIAVLGYLDDHTTVHATLAQPDIQTFIHDLLHNDLLPVTDIPDGANGQDYVAAVLERFQNAALPYQVQQINTDCSQKIQQRWFPSIDRALAQGKSSERLSLMLAAWFTYVQTALPRDQLNDPCAKDYLRLAPANATLEDYLAIAGADQFAFSTHAVFLDQVRTYHGYLKTRPAHQIARQLTKQLNNNTHKE